MSENRTYTHVPRNNSIHIICPECKSTEIYRETCMKCGLVLGKYYVNFDLGRGNTLQECVENTSHELTPDYLKGTTIAYGEVLSNVKGKQRGVFKRLVKIQQQSYWWNDTYVRRIGTKMTNFLRFEGYGYEIQNTVYKQWRKGITLLKKHKGRAIFLTHLAVSVIYAVLRNYYPTYRIRKLIDYFGVESNINRTDVVRIISQLRIPFKRPTRQDYIEVGIEAVSPMYYHNIKDAETFIPRLRQNVAKLYRFVDVGGEDEMNMLSAILYGACHIEAINQKTKLPRTVTTPRIAERLGRLPYSVRCIYNRKIKEIVENYREDRKK